MARLKKDIYSTALKQRTPKKWCNEFFHRKNLQAAARSKNVLFLCFTIRTEEVESLTSKRHNKLLQAKVSVCSAVLVVELRSALALNSKALPSQVDCHDF